MKKISLKQLAKKINAELIGTGDINVSNLNSIHKAGPEHLTYVESEKYISKLKESKAPAVLVNKKIEDCDKTQLIVQNVDAAVIDVLNFFAPKLTVPQPGIHPGAVVDPSAKIDNSASIGPNCTVQKNAVIGKNCILKANVFVGENSTVDENSKLDANVTIYHGCRIGKNCLIQAGAVIGAVGFGYSFIDGQHRMIPHNGGVIVEDAVHIGANCCVDRAKFGDTIIGAGTKMDNLIQVGHGTKIGKCCIIVSHVGLGGSTELGNGVVLGGQVGIANLVKIGDRTRIGAQSGVMADIPPGKDMLGAPAVDVKERLRQFMAIQKMPDALKQLKKLTKRIEKLESSADNS